MLAKEVRALPPTLLVFPQIWGGVGTDSDPMQGQRLREEAERRERDADGGESLSSDEEEIEEELGFISPLDSVNPYVTFKQALSGTSPLPLSPFPRTRVGPPRS